MTPAITDCVTSKASASAATSSTTGCTIWRNVPVAPRAGRFVPRPLLQGGNGLFGIKDVITSKMVWPGQGSFSPFKGNEGRSGQLGFGVYSNDCINAGCRWRRRKTQNLAHCG